MRTRFSVREVLLLAAVGVSALALACSGGGGTKETAATPASGAKASSPAASSGGAGGALSVELADFTLKATAASAKAGKVEFTAKNGGTTPHELVVLKTDVDAGALQKNASGIVDETKYTVSGKTKEVAAGASEKLDLTLTAGKYVLLCNVAGHYDLGMRTAFTVN